MQASKSADVTLLFTAFANPALASGLKKIQDYDGFEIEAAHNAAKLIDAVYREARVYSRKEDELQKKHAGQKLTPSYSDDLRDLQAQFRLIEGVSPIPLELLKSVKLTPNELRAFLWAVAL